MDRKSFAALALVALSLPASLAQDTTLNLTDLPSQVQSRFTQNRFKQARIDRMPANYLSDEVTVQTAGVDQASTAQQNMLILGCFAVLLTAGGIITGLSLAKRRRRAQKVNVAPPIKLCV